MSDKEIKMVKKIKDSYIERKTTKLDELKALNKKVERPAEIFAYTFGTAGALILGTGMSMAMEVIFASGALTMPIGIAIGVVGLAMVSANYFIYQKILTKRKQKYAKQVLALTDELLQK